MSPSEKLSFEDLIYDCKKEIRDIESRMYDCRPSTKLAYEDRIYDLHKIIRNAQSKLNPFGW